MNETIEINVFFHHCLGGYGKEVMNMLRRVSKFSVYPHEFPLTLGRDFSGVVVDVGKLVKNVKAGDEVLGVIGPGSPGSHAQYLLATKDLVRMSPHIKSAKHEKNIR